MFSGHVNNFCLVWLTKHKCHLALTLIKLLFLIAKIVSTFYVLCTFLFTFITKM